jgi:hypothetical protein
MSAGDCFLRNRLEDLDDCSILSAHHNRGTFGNETFDTQWREMVPDRLLQSLLATGPSNRGAIRRRSPPRLPRGWRAGFSSRTDLPILLDYCAG